MTVQRDTVDKAAAADVKQISGLWMADEDEFHSLRTENYNSYNAPHTANFVNLHTSQFKSCLILHSIRNKAKV